MYGMVCATVNGIYDRQRGILSVVPSVSVSSVLRVLMWRASSLLP